VGQGDIETYYEDGTWKNKPEGTDRAFGAGSGPEVMAADAPRLVLPQRNHTDARRGSMAEPLPTFDEMRSNAYAMLGDVEDELRSDWRDGAGPTNIQAEALRVARQAIDQAKAALNRAARCAQPGVGLAAPELADVRPSGQALFLFGTALR
jgi:hypothetical protein